ncbi:fungal specific transcription factor domain-containing protein [Zalerion maritima]|uniref:Fungal specific transcription factor domain-containing protein n=1 Tax=Zalerion maritima TaxID=339359 RepID=A0AAD5RQN0_9PEZI|nr:fungal specific transcription factor domain-containing protein [Zalerion maritima]
MRKFLRFVPTSGWDKKTRQTSRTQETCKPQRTKDEKEVRIMMDQLENQVSDLRYLTQNVSIPLDGAPASGTTFPMHGAASTGNASRPQHSSALSATNSAHHGHQHSASSGSISAINSPLHHHGVSTYAMASTPGGPSAQGSVSGPISSGSNKRKTADVDDGNASGPGGEGSASGPLAKQTRSKRNRYLVYWRSKIHMVDLYAMGLGCTCNAINSMGWFTVTSIVPGKHVACQPSNTMWGVVDVTPLQRHHPPNLAESSQPCLYHGSGFSLTYRAPPNVATNANAEKSSATGKPPANDSEEFKRVTSQVTQLQEQVDTLFATINSLRSETLRLAPIQDRPLPPPVVPSPSPSISVQPLHKPELPGIKSFRGPTSLGFSLEVAKNTLHNLGIGGGQQHSDGDRDGANSHVGPLSTPSESVTSPFHPPAPPRQSLPPSVNSADFSDPLWDFDKDEMIQLCQLHEEEIGIMYPVVQIKTIIDHVMVLHRWMESSRTRRVILDDSMLVQEKTLQLKIIMCCALVVDGHGKSERASRIYESIQNITNRRLMSDEGEISRVPFLALVAGYRFLANEEVLAWRVMGQVARLCLELGLHRSESVFKIDNEEDRNNAVNTFWSAYVLDRRWSFGTGLPYVVQDDQIDPHLPLPTQFPYLVAMVTYSRVGAKVWKIVPHFQPLMDCEPRQDEIESMDGEILEWYASVPKEVQIEHWGEIKPMPSTPSYNLERLQIWTRLRLNQMRIWLYTPILHTNTSIMAHLELASLAVSLAQDTISYLYNLNNTSNIYRKIQVFYHQFLTSAIAVLFLASVHAPVQFSTKCRREFYLALELVKDLSSKSWVSQRLWQTIKSLKDDGRPLGLVSDDEENGNRYQGQGTEHPTAVSSLVTSASLASSSPTPSSSGTLHGQYGNARGPPLPPVTGPAGAVGRRAEEESEVDNGTRLHDEMSKIFEGYTGMNGLPPLAPRAWSDDGVSSMGGDGGSRSNGAVNGVYFPGHAGNTPGTNSPRTEDGQPIPGGYQIPTPGSVYPKLSKMF